MSDAVGRPGCGTRRDAQPGWRGRWRSVPEGVSPREGRGRRSVRDEPAEHREAWVDVVVGVVVVALVERQAANDAQTGAVLAIQRRNRQGEHDRLADRLFQVELVMVRQADDA